MEALQLKTIEKLKAELDQKDNEIAKLSADIVCLRKLLHKAVIKFCTIPKAVRKYHGV